jgi:two-component system LytT family sensor kinase
MEKDPEQIEHDIIYPLFQLAGWSIAAIYWLFILKTTPIPLSFSIYQNGIALLISHFVLRRWLRWQLKQTWTLLKRTSLTILVLLSCILLISLLNGPFFIFYSIFALPNGSPKAHFEIGRMILGSLDMLLLLSTWTTAYIGWITWRNLRKETSQRIALESAYKDATLDSLRQQLNPHFIFNALNSIRAMIDEDGKVAQDMTTELSTLLRYSLYHGQQSLVSIKDELNMVENYLAIEQRRYEERLHIKMDINSILLEYAIPPLALQTFVENAIKHNIQKKKRGITY